jgi:hypothetical protein
MNYDGMITTNMAITTAFVGAWVSIEVVDGVLKRGYGREADACDSRVLYMSSFTSSLRLHRNETIWRRILVFFTFLIQQCIVQLMVRHTYNTCKNLSLSCIGIVHNCDCSCYRIPPLRLLLLLPRFPLPPPLLQPNLHARPTRILRHGCVSIKPRERRAVRDIFLLFCPLSQRLQILFFRRKTLVRSSRWSGFCDCVSPLVGAGLRCS